MSQPTERESLKKRADLMGLTYAKNIGTDALRELVNEKVLGNQEPEVKVTREKTEADTTGEIIGKQRQELTKLRRVIISCNDPQMKEWETTPYLSFSNSILTLPKITVPFNVEWHVPQAYYDMIKNAVCGIAVKGKDDKGRTVTVRKEIKKYSVQDLPDLDADELESLKQAQIMRDGLKAK